MKKQRSRRKQCAHCPWKVTTDPLTIPRGYSEQMHCNLSNTIADLDAPPKLGGVFRIMACHESPIGREYPCIGWLHNQLNDGNNLQLRIAVRFGALSADYELTGEQHPAFKDTLPEK